MIFIIAIFILPLTIFLNYIFFGTFGAIVATIAILLAPIIIKENEKQRKEKEKIMFDNKIK